MYDRAMKRVPDVTRLNGRTFVVLGSAAFKDTYPQYEVTWKGGDEYACSCYALDHGDSRARRGCSHVLAVKLFRENIKVESGSVNASPPAGDAPRSESQAQQLRALPLPDSLVVESDASTREDEGQLRDVDATTSAPVGHSDSTLTLVPSVKDSRFTQWDTLPLPPKFEAIHPHQWTAVCEAGECYDRGVEVVWMDAPTGSGKTLMAELIRRLTQRNAFYICNSKTLQQQFVTDFSYARLLMGRSNYPTQTGGRDVTCADCTMNGPDDDCLWCPDTVTCAYQVARAEAIRAKLAVLNTAYFLTESNYVGNVGKGRELGIIDECDTLESELMGFVEFYLGERMLQRVGLKPPKDGSHRTTIGKWLVDDLKPALHAYQQTIRGNDLRTIRERMSAARLMADVLRIASQVEKDEGLTGWVRDNKAGPLVLKPVVVSDYGDRYVWQHAKKWLCMSATIISAAELSDSCGLSVNDETGNQRWELVTVPMTFPVENRRIVLAPVADMSRKGKDAGEWEHAAKAIGRIIARHPGERILIHTVSYDLAQYLSTHQEIRDTGRPLLSYRQASDRDSVLDRFRRTSGAVLFAASMDRGVDLAGDDCRVVIVAKVPFPYLGDRQIGERMRMPGGQAWYSVQTVRKLVQMTGRAVRSKNDWCVTYIVDRQFTKNVWGKNKGLLPKWWREAVDTDSM
jgi:ATP-dependent DNA helicase DinG